MEDKPIYTGKELLQKVAKGDEESFRIFFRQWQPFLATHIFRITESRELAEEVVQDVFLKIWMTRETLTSVNNIKAFLITISRNHAINELNKMLREWGRVKHLEGEQLAQTTDSTAENLSQLKYALLDEAIDKLPPRQKEIYLLNRHQRLSYQEIAQKLSIGRESVKRNLQLASQAITKYINARLALLIFLLEQYK